MIKIGWIIVIITMLVLMGVFIFFAFRPSAIPDAAGWVQNAIAIISFPVIFYELNQIRQNAVRKPNIKIGLVNVSHLPLSKVQQLPILSNKIIVAEGYLHFWVAIRNKGKAVAKTIKVRLEFSSTPNPCALRNPVIAVSKMDNDTRYTFKMIHNREVGSFWQSMLWKWQSASGKIKIQMIKGGVQ